MLRAQRVMDLLPSEAKPIVNPDAFHAATTGFGAAVKDMDAFGAGPPAYAIAA
jgi:hypothetical protein